MGLPALAPPPRRLVRVRFAAGVYRLDDDGGSLGGVFTSASAAADFARAELRGVPGVAVVVDPEPGR